MSQEGAMQSGGQIFIEQVQRSRLAGKKSHFTQESSTRDTLRRLAIDVAERETVRGAVMQSGASGTTRTDYNQQQSQSRQDWY
jgi:hypothetical protein